MKALIAAVLMLHGCQRPGPKGAAPGFQSEPVGLREAPTIILRDVPAPSFPVGPTVIIHTLPQGPFVILL